jgi:hypothetical protein
MKLFSVLLGARNTPASGRAFTRKDDRLLRTLTSRHFPDGFTILNADGGWYDPDKARFVEEQSRQILVGTDDRRQLRA